MLCYCFTFIFDAVIEDCLLCIRGNIHLVKLRAYNIVMFVISCVSYAKNFNLTISIHLVKLRAHNINCNVGMFVCNLWETFNLVIFYVYSTMLQFVCYLCENFNLVIFYIYNKAIIMVDCKID